MPKGDKHTHNPTVHTRVVCQLPLSMHTLPANMPRLCPSVHTQLVAAIVCTGMSLL